MLIASSFLLSSSTSIAPTLGYSFKVGCCWELKSRECFLRCAVHYTSPSWFIFHARPWSFSRTWVSSFYVSPEVTARRRQAQRTRDTLSKASCTVLELARWGGESEREGPRALVLNRSGGNFAPQGTFNHVWRHLWLPQLEQRQVGSWHRVSGGQRCCRTSYSTQDTCLGESIESNMANVPRLGHPEVEARDFTGWSPVTLL